MTCHLRKSADNYMYCPLFCKCGELCGLIFKCYIMISFLQEIQFGHNVLTLKYSTWIQFVNTQLQSIFIF